MGRQLEKWQLLFKCFLLHQPPMPIFHVVNSTTVPNGGYGCTGPTVSTHWHAVGVYQIPGDRVQQWYRSRVGAEFQNQHITNIIEMRFTDWLSHGWPKSQFELHGDDNLCGSPPKRTNYMQLHAYKNKTSMDTILVLPISPKDRAMQQQWDVTQ